MNSLVRRASFALVAAFALGAAPWGAAPAGAQMRLRDLVVTLGGSVEAYAGNLSAVTVPAVDSADQAVSMVGEMGVRGTAVLSQTRSRSFELAFDGGMRQAAAFGFTLRDYAPREWVGSVAGRYTQSVGSWGTILIRTGIRGREIEDRPPMPLFLQPGYATIQGSVGVLTRPLDGLSFDGQVDLERADYRALQAVPQLDFLDRNSSGIEAGVRWGGASTMRFYGAFRWTDHTNQGSFDPSDPFRRDHTARVGLEWAYEGEVAAQIGVDGTVNRSNSNRPEYDALSARLFLSAPLPSEVSLIVYVLLTAKSYVHDPAYVLLVPGEEANNASVAYVQLSRSVGANLDAALRVGWTRAETDIGSTYFRRVGASLRLNYRPAAF